MKRENKIIAGMCVACYIMVLLPSANAKKVPDPTQTPNAALRPSESLSGGTESKSSPTPEDFWKPLDNWLKYQGSPLSGKDAYEVGKQYGIDPDFLIAVTKAETQLCKVKQRGSEFNCGSVGSYDSTNTTFQANSYRHGFEQIAQTVNNNLLRRYSKISELSRSHNKNQSPVYATSDGNWFRNCLATMNALKGKNEQDYVFRR